MTVHLDRLLQALEQVEAEASRRLEPRYTAAVLGFPADVSTLDEFSSAIGQFAARVWLGEIADDAEASRMMFRPIWERVESHWGTLGNAMHIYRGELEGGRRVFLNRLFAACVAQQVSVRNESLVEEFWRSVPTELDAHIALTEHYCDRFGHLLPADMREGAEASRALMLRSLLRTHVARLAEARAGLRW